MSRVDLGKKKLEVKKLECRWNDFRKVKKKIRRQNISIDWMENWDKERGCGTEWKECYILNGEQVLMFPFHFQHLSIHPLIYGIYCTFSNSDIFSVFRITLNIQKAIRVWKGGRKRGRAPIAPSILKSGAANAQGRWLLALGITHCGEHFGNTEVYTFSWGSPGLRRSVSKWTSKYLQNFTLHPSKASST